MAQLVTGLARTWPSILSPGQWWFCFSALLKEHKLCSDAFILALASSWAYHFLYTCYQKSQCKYWVLGHLVLEVNQLQSQEAWAYFPASCKTVGKQLTSRELRVALSEVGAVILLHSLAPSSESRVSEMTGVGIPGRDQGLRKKSHWEQLPLADHCPSILAAGIFSWRQLKFYGRGEAPLWGSSFMDNFVYSAVVWWGYRTPELFTFSIFTTCVYLLWKGVITKSFLHLINETHWNSPFLAGCVGRRNLLFLDA